MIHFLLRPHISLFVLSLMILGHVSGRAQGNNFDLKKSSELYDERGFLQNKAVTVDGNLVVSNSNGNVSYSYPISSYNPGGHPINTTLNYCGSVSFTTFKDYKEGSRASGEYVGWSKFDQNRPAWILGVNGFAVQVLATSTHFRSDRKSTGLHSPSRTTFNDADLVWAIDGYDYCNRMNDFDAVGSSISLYVDEIRLLRSDGSILELLNVQSDDTSALADTRPELYTGIYYTNEANNQGYGIVEYDSLYWTDPIKYAQRNVNSSELYPLIPRKLRYYPGDGLEYLFREVVAPYGLPAYNDAAANSGGLWGGPTIFYLESIGAIGGELIGVGRQRHYPIVASFNAGMHHDSTRGRATTSAFSEHQITYGVNSLTIEAFGRTTKVKFQKVLPSGNATETDWMPIAAYGIPGEWQRTLANTAETSSSLYKSYLGYVTEIVDPEGRSTKFEYETYSRTYRNFGFPRAPENNVPVDVTLQNVRLKKVTDPTSIYDIAYYGNTSALLLANTTSNAYLLNNYASSVIKKDKYGTALTRHGYRFDFYQGLGGVDSTRVATAVDTLFDYSTGLSKYNRFHYGVVLLPDMIHGRPQPRFTDMYKVEEVAGAWSTVTNTIYSTRYDSDTMTSPWGTASPIQEPRWTSPYLILPTETTTYVNNVLKSDQRFDYTVDVVRTFGGDTLLASMFGREPLTKVTSTWDPGNAQLYTRDTLHYLHLAAIDTAYTRQDTFLLKFQMMQKFFNLRESGLIPRRWEDAMFHPLIYTYFVETWSSQKYLPPVYGLVQRQSIVTGSGQYLQGKINGYNTVFNANDQFTTSLRGSIAADTVIGYGGTRKVPSSQISYSGGWGMYRPSYIQSANGAAQRLYYNYAIPELYNSSGPYFPLNGKRVSHRDSTTNISMEGGEYFSSLLSTPVVEQQSARRYTPAGALSYDTVNQVFRRTFYGLASASLDPNGHYSSFEYDKNGRLKYAALPFDFQSSDSATKVSVVAREFSEGYGWSFQDYRQFTLDCTDGPTGDTTYQDLGLDVADSGKFYVSKPVNTTGKCPCEHASAEKEEAPRVQGTCETDVTYWAMNPAKGYVSFRVIPEDADTLTVVDSASINLYVSSVTGTCVDLTVKIPSINFEAHYLLNCSAGGGAETSTREKDRIEITSVDDPDSYLFKVNLSSVKNALRGFRKGDTMRVELSTATSGGRIDFVSGMDAEDTRPNLFIKGTFLKSTSFADNTLSYTYDDAALTSTVVAKVDDSRHTHNRFGGGSVAPVARRTEAKHYFGADGRLLRSHQTIGNPSSPLRVDSVTMRYSGTGQKTRVKDQLGDTTATEFDAMGRPTQVINPDGTRSTIAYQAGSLTTCGITDGLQNFHGFCSATVTTNETSISFAKYTDGFDRLRREVADVGGLALMTRYDYDELGRITLVINPKGDSTRYTYDDFGRVKTRRQPDLGTISHAYDHLGNVRFTQSQQQANDSKLTYSQYDDLNRLVVTGEADVSWQGTGRVTDAIDPTRLHTGAVSSILTANKTLWTTPQSTVPTFWSLDSLVQTTCALGIDTLLGETETPVGPFLSHPVRNYPVPATSAADTGSFENIATYPQFVRMAISYDRLPARSGAVWSAFPTYATWDSLAPRRQVRNLKGHEAAIAYREHGGEAYHYLVMSYDERGRVEALLRYTENLGFDAVYYTYNSMNQVTSIRVADPLRQHTSWYGYDYNGRVDSVWTALSAVGSGIGVTATPKYPAPAARPDSAEIDYAYGKTGQIATMRYRAVNVLVSYAYNRRMFLDSLVATQGGANVFKEVLGYDSSGQIITQRWKHGAAAEQQQIYGYDNVQRLTSWGMGTDLTSYTYDAMGNRTVVSYANPLPAGTDQYQYIATGRPNGLSDVKEKDAANVVQRWTTYGYNGNGAIVDRFRRNAGGMILKEEHLGYSYRDLLRRYVIGPESNKLQEWTYRYNAEGEREQKRLTLATNGGHGTGDRLGWVYYLLGGSNEQLAIYNGQESIGVAECNEGGTDKRVSLYPTEYNTIAASTVQVTIRPEVGSPSGRKEFRVVDHLGSLRAVISANGAVSKEIDYNPFGEVVSGGATRLSFINKESDRENELGDFGVRKYEYETGRFLSVDPLWAEDYPNTPYHYSGNDPQNCVDPSGLQLSRPQQNREAHPSPALGVVVPGGPSGAWSNTIFRSGSNSGAGALRGGGGSSGGRTGGGSGGNGGRGGSGGSGRSGSGSSGGSAGKPGTYVKSNSPAVQRTLPKSKHGVMEPDSPYPHTQLGRSTKSHGAEPQAREWNYDYKGRLVPKRDIDFTDHKSPSIHPNPHQHTLTPVNPKQPVRGGFHRGDPQPFP